MTEAAGCQRAGDGDYGWTARNAGADAVQEGERAGAGEDQNYPKRLHRLSIFEGHLRRCLNILRR